MRESGPASPGIVEFKFAAPTGEVGAHVLTFLNSLPHIEGFRVIARQSEALTDHYYDTPDFFFDRNHKAVRQRIRAGSPPMLEIKEQGRPSTEHPVYRLRSQPLDKTGRAVKGADDIPAGLQALAPLLTGADALQRIATIRNDRTRLV